MIDASSSNTPTSHRVQVLIVDDHPVIRDALSDVIAQKIDMAVFGQAGSAEVALQLMEDQQPDVAIVDILLGDAHGLDLMQNIRAQYPDVHVIIFSMYDESVYAERAVRAGASGYVMKAESMQRVVEAIRIVVRGEIYLSHKMASYILGRVVGGRSSNAGFPVDELTDREMSVFQLLGQGYNLKEIAEQLNIHSKTVETYRRRAKEKLGLDSVTDLLQYAIHWTHSQGGDGSSSDVPSLEYSSRS